MSNQSQVDPNKSIQIDSKSKEKKPNEQNNEDHVRQDTQGGGRCQEEEGQDDRDGKKGRNNCQNGDEVNQSQNNSRIKEKENNKENSYSKNKTNTSQNQTKLPYIYTSSSFNTPLNL